MERIGAAVRRTGVTIPAHLQADEPDGRSTRLPPRPAAARDLRAVDASPIPTFERFYADERRSIGRAVAFAVGDVDLAAEAVDEAFARAFERWRTVRLGNPAGWVYRVAVNWSLSVLRRRKLARRHLYRPDDELPVPVEPDVHAALAELDPKHRSVVVCRHLLGWSVAETAAALHLREGTVKSRLSRANRQLQVRLSHHRSEENRP